MSRLAGTLSYYGRWAGLYDLVASAPVVDGVRKRAVAECRLDPGDTVVEMGCGTGANLSYLREAVGPEGTVFGVDLVPEMLQRARRRIEEAGWGNVHVARADATRPPLAASSPADGLCPDAVLATFVVGMLPDPGAAVRGWLDLLGPGGRLVLLNASRNPSPLAAPANLLFRGFVRLNAAGDRTTPYSPARRLEAKVDAARDTLRSETSDAIEERLGLGYLRLNAGTQSPESQFIL